MEEHVKDGLIKPLITTATAILGTITIAEREGLTSTGVILRTLRKNGIFATRQFVLILVAGQ